MSIMDGCESKHRTPVLEERICPDCGNEVEVFTVRGRILEKAVCTCGYTFEPEEILPLKTEQKEKDS